MAPSSGHHLVPKALRILRSTINQATSVLRPNVSANSAAQRSVQTASQKRIPIHPLAFLKQSRSVAGSRWFSSTTSSNAKTGKRAFDRSSLPISRTSQAVFRSGASPFASTLRPNLTGGALPRTAGGYSLGIGRGGGRHFSHTSGCQAQVLQNVSAGIRAFFVNGGKVKYDGVDPASGNKRWKSIGKAEDNAYQQLRKHSNAQIGAGQKWQQGQDIGTSLDFHISPTITAFLSNSLSKDSPSPFGNDEPAVTLQTSGVLPALSMDFARALHDLSLIHRDLDLLSKFGALPFTLHQELGTRGPVLRVRFPGCDADTVTKLCDEVGVKRGIIIEDEEWRAKENKEVDMALLFPFAPTSQGSDVDNESAAGYFKHERAPRAHRGGSEAEILLTNDSSSLPSPLHSISHASTQFTINPALINEIDLSTIPSFPSSSSADRDMDPDLDLDPSTGTDILTPSHSSADDNPTADPAEDYEGMEGIYRFLRECDEAAAAARRL